MFVGIGVAIIGLGAVLIAFSFDPGAFGVTTRYGFPFAGGFLGIFLILWGTLLLVRAAVRVGRYRYGAGPPGRRFDPAILAARQRYARGEITREQFQQIVTDLRPPPGPGRGPPGPLP